MKCELTQILPTTVLSFDFGISTPSAVRPDLLALLRGLNLIEEQLARHEEELSICLGPADARGGLSATERHVKWEQLYRQGQELIRGERHVSKDHSQGLSLLRESAFLGHGDSALALQRPTGVYLANSNTGAAFFSVLGSGRMLLKVFSPSNFRLIRDTLLSSGVMVWRTEMELRKMSRNWSDTSDSPLIKEPLPDSTIMVYGSSKERGLRKMFPKPPNTSNCRLVKTTRTGNALTLCVWRMEVELRQILPKLSDTPNSRRIRAAPAHSTNTGFVWRKERALPKIAEKP
jgi:hypothetical protein